MSIVFNSQIDFERAVMEVLKERLSIHVTVSKVKSIDYYSDVKDTKVKVSLAGEYEGEISSAEDHA